ncbi:MAG: chromosomal replication initiator protein DnaA, partial [Planctomycetes bacterium]|nr:chromosomal replication initiator protein DnaA [Planctomycetota bacterium]
PAPSPAAAPYPEPSRPLSPLAAQLNPRYTFDNYVVGAENRLAHAAALAVADNPSKAYNPLFLYGSVGVGKTHLLQAVCHTLLRRNPRANLLYLSCEEFVNEFLSAIMNPRTMDTFRGKHRGADVLVIDDIHFLTAKEQSQEEIFHTFNTLHNAQRQIILSSDQAPQDIPTLQERLVSRFKWGMVASLSTPGLETRTAILRKKAEEMRAELPPGGVADEVLDFLAGSIERNVRELVGAFTTIAGTARLSGQPLTIAFARSVLTERGHLRPQMVDVRRIQEEVARYYGIKPTDLTSSKRGKANIAEARHLAIYLARTLTRMSQSEVGDLFNRDHSTVLNSEQVIARKLTEDADFSSTLKMLESRILKPA